MRFSRKLSSGLLSNVAQNTKTTYRHLIFNRLHIDIVVQTPRDGSPDDRTPSNVIVLLLLISRIIPHTTYYILHPTLSF